ncbi:venom carboxylesterase-6-like [Maniola hyperantus]|uniref:venom carboxylesterase-6-like n=1 Tax=Aphantopus hyperantus TaxID=2795564 RepID=UPI001567E086|nr:venom carboxylesterase-6-like [Maniola hyperantus]
MWLLLCLCALAYAQEAPRVNTTQGVVVGLRIEDGDYLAFYGLHYGGNTGDENRFKAPTPPPAYPGEFHAIDNTILCAQQGPRGLIGKEDCLVLNIHTKNVTTPKPVMVWIEGEEYESAGRTPYNFKNLVQQDLLVVSINYRVSIFGFLCLGVTDAPGNAGLKDIIQGLKWIKENIAGFGGDPNNVILIGHGSGAAMVDLITMSPMSQNLVHKAIVLSGSGLAPWAVSYDPIGYAEQVGRKLGYTDASREDLAKKLASTDISLLSGVLSDFEFFNASLLFAPCVENAKLNPNDTFLSDAPINILRSGNYIHIPYLAGFVDREGTVRAGQAAVNNWLEKMETTFGNFIPVDLAFESEDNRTAVTRNIRQYYFAERTVNMETIEDYLEYHGDSLILVPAIRGTKERALTSRANVWLFKFTFRGTQNSDWAYPQIPLNGARHGAILNYLFNYDLRTGDNTASTSITQRFKAFAYNGNPAPSFPTTATPWDPITNQSAPILLMSGGETSNRIDLYNEQQLTHVNRETTEFWDPIIATYYRPPNPVSSANTLLSFGLVLLATQTLLRLL